MKYPLIFLFLLIGIHSSAEISPYYKEVVQRGYSYANDTVTFPDGSKCSIKDFNEERCGTEWMTEDYCIPKGQYVWDKNKCCNDLAPYLEEGSDGQAVCMEKKSWWEVDLFSFWLGLFIPFAFFGIIILSVRKRLKQRNKPK